MTARRVFRSTAGWAFGFSVTILFIALWGRAVVIDTETLAESLAPLGDTAVVGGVVADWMTDELVDSGYPEDVVEPAVDLVLDSSATASAIDTFVAEVVIAAASSDPNGSEVDVASLLLPAVPDVTRGLAEMDLAVNQSDVAAIVAELDPIVITETGSAALVGPESAAAARLGTAAILALLSMVLFGYATVAFSEDRIAAVRGLFSRVAIGGLGFAILLLVGSWITDPNGGRAPIPETISAVASSKWLVPMQIGTAAALVAGSIYVGRRWLRRVGVFRSSDEQTTQPEGQPQSLSETG